MALITFFLFACLGFGSFGFNRFYLSWTFVISDSNVSELYAGTIFRLLSNEVSRANVREAYFLVVDAGEESKSVNWLSTLWQSLLEVGADRKTLIVAVGGGVIGDLAGFVFR